jgi:hypothetical protein
MSTDDWVKEAVCQFVAEEGDWLCCSLRRVKTVSDGRKSEGAYGFEWLIHTAFSHWLLQRDDVADLVIGQQGKNRRKYDLDLKVLQQRIIIQIKTIAPGGISYVKSDVNQSYSPNCTPYFLVFSYPNESDEIPRLEGTSGICTGIAPEKFRYYLYKKSEQVVALDGDSAALHPRQ